MQINPSKLRRIRRDHHVIKAWWSSAADNDPCIRALASCHKRIDQDAKMSHKDRAEVILRFLPIETFLEMSLWGASSIVFEEKLDDFVSQNAQLVKWMSASPPLKVTMIGSVPQKIKDDLLKEAYWFYSDEDDPILLACLNVLPRHEQRPMGAIHKDVFVSLPMDEFLMAWAINTKRFELQIQ